MLMSVILAALSMGQCCGANNRGAADELITLKQKHSAGGGGEEGGRERV